MTRQGGVILKLSDIAAQLGGDVLDEYDRRHECK